VRRRRTVLLAALLLVTACGAAVEEREPYGATDLRTGAAVSVADLAGAPALLVSWTTWCTECDEVLGGLRSFSESPAAARLEIVAVNLDVGDVDDEIDAKLADHGLSTTLWRDRRNEFKRAFGALGVPTAVLLDAEGRVAGTFPGAVDFENGPISEALAGIASGSPP
jgi:thiol-disulfide isomerase/thioredoxin